MTETNILQRTKNWLLTNYHIPTAIAILFIAIFIRVASYTRYMQGDKMLLSGNDAWYHFRQVEYTIQNWPFTMEFDPWTGYPVGSDPGHFGTLFDQILATLSIIISPFVSNPTGLVMIFAPPLIAVAGIIGVYFIGLNLKDRLTGIIAMLFLTLMPSVYLTRGLAGVADHNIAEPVFMVFSVIGIVYGLKVAKKESFVLESFYDLDKKIIFRAMISSLYISIPLFLYILVWPPAMLMIGILGIYYLINSIVEYSHKNNQESILIQGAFAGIFLTIGSLVFLDRTGVSTTHIGLVHLLLSVGLIFGSLFLLFVSRYFRNENRSVYEYVASLTVVTIISSLVSWLISPRIIYYITENFLRFIGFGTISTQRTIREAIPLYKMGNIIVQLFSQYRFLFLLAIVGFVLQLYMSRSKKNYNIISSSNPVYVFLAVWFIFTLSAGLTQVRFNYYLSTSVAVFSAYSTVLLFELTGLNNLEYDFSMSDIKGYQIITIFFIATVIFAPLIYAPGQPSAIDQSSRNGPGSYTIWSDSLEWMQDNTPEYDSLDYYEGYEDTQDFDYEDDVYGVMSWWDYGHWITVGAERVPVANPFQQHAEEAAKFLLSDNEEEALDPVKNLSDEDNVRYVMIDWQTAMAQQKFSAPIVWNPDVEREQFFNYPMLINNNNVVYSKSQRFYESMVTRLYTLHGSGSKPSRLVVEGRLTQTRRGGQYLSVSGENSIKKFNTSEEAQEYANNNNQARVVGIGTHPPEKLDALEHYRLVRVGNVNALRTPSYSRQIRSLSQVSSEDVSLVDFFRSPSAVKTFERVDGAEIKGSGAEPNSEVMAQVAMNTQRGSTFIYRQYAQADSEGNFEMTVPYSTTDYGTTEEGYTNLSTTAQGSYTILSRGQNQTLTASVHVPDPKVVEEDNDTVSVNLGEDSGSGQEQSDD